MKNHGSRLKIISLTTIFSFLFLLFGSMVQAQSTLPLMVMPARQEIEVEPGEKVYLNTAFYNKSDDPVSGFFKTADFIVEDNQGTPKLFENIDQAPPKFAASNWFELFYDRVTLPAHDRVQLQTTINVPLDAKPGGRYVAIFFEQGGITPKTTNNPEEAGLGVASRIASLIYLKIKGPITEKAIVSRFFAPYFFEYGPVKIETDIMNKGDYHISPNGVISMTNMFGGVIDQKRLEGKNIFPETLRTFKSEVGTKWMAGRYKVSLLGSYGSTGQVIESSIYVWVFPWRVAAAVILSVIITIIIISRLYRNLIVKETTLEEELAREKSEIDKLKEQLRKRG